MAPLALSLWLHLPNPEPINPLPAIFAATAVDSELRDVFWPLSEANENQKLAATLTQQSRLGQEWFSPAADSSNTAFRSDGDRLNRKNALTSDWAAVSGQLSVRDPEFAREDPLRRGPAWATNETVRVPVGETIFVFSAIDAANDAAEQKQLRWLGKTGVGLKLRPWFLKEVQLRGGPAMRYDETDRAVNGSAERSELFVEISTKLPVPILGPINIEYIGTSVQAVTAAERDRLNQNLKFALPLRDGSSQFQMGARWWSEDSPTPAPFIDRAQLYLGIQLKR